jgi:excisionase family DNA binding protein
MRSKREKHHEPRAHCRGPLHRDETDAEHRAGSVFSLLASNAFREDDFTHDQVFGETHQEPFSTWEAAEYLEVSVPTLRRYVQSGKLVPSHVVGRNQMFSAQTLRAFKRSRGSRA